MKVELSKWLQGILRDAFVEGVKCLLFHFHTTLDRF